MEKYTLCREETRMVYIIVHAKSKAEALCLANGNWPRKVTDWKPKCKWRLLNSN